MVILSMKLKISIIVITIGDYRLLYKEQRKLTKITNCFYCEKLARIIKIEDDSHAQEIKDIQKRWHVISCYICSGKWHFHVNVRNPITNIFNYKLTQTKEYLVCGTEFETKDKSWVVNAYYHSHTAGNWSLFTTLKLSFEVEKKSEEKSFKFIKETRSECKP